MKGNIVYTDSETDKIILRTSSEEYFLLTLDAPRTMMLGDEILGRFRSTRQIPVFDGTRWEPFSGRVDGEFTKLSDAFAAANDFRAP